MSPLQRVGKSDTMVMTQYPQKALEKIGLLKMDFLGLANLTMLAKAVEYIKRVTRRRDRPEQRCRSTIR